MNDLDRSYDELLIILIKMGDRRAGERLAVRWYPRLLRTARRILRDDDLARDAVQEAWSGICRSWMTLNDPSRFPAFAHRILARRCTDRVRKISQQRQHFEAEMTDEVADPHENVPTDRLAIDQAFATLTPDQRMLGALFFAEGLSLSEIADVMSIPVGTVKSRLFHTRRRLKAALKGDPQDEQ